MRIIEPGHRYGLDNVQSGEQQLNFIQKEKTGEDEQLVVLVDGTTNEEVLAVLIDRIKLLQSKVPSRESAIVITKLEESLMWLEKRTADRVARGVENTSAK